MTLSKKKKWIFRLILLLFLGVVLELFSSYFTNYLRSRPIGDAFFVMRHAHAKDLGPLIQKAVKDPFFDPELGWCRKPEASQKTGPDGLTYTFVSDGSRFCGDLPGEPMIAFYGCSGIMGLEVSDGDTIPFLVSRAAGIPVKNWGTPAFGMDQSLMMFERKLRDSKPHAPVAVLSFGTDTIKRLVNAWKLFYSGENLIKPKFIEKEGKLVAANPILENPELYFDKSDEEIVRALVPYDFWLPANYKGWSTVKPARQFPYTLSLAQAGLYYLGRSHVELAFPEKPNQTFLNVYDQKESFDLMCRLTDRFFNDCKQNGIKGYLLIITEHFYMDLAAGRLKSRTFRHPRKFDDNYIAYLESKGYPYVDTMPVAEKAYQAEGSYQNLFCTYEHPSPKMTALMAAEFMDKLKKDGVLDDLKRRHLKAPAP